MTNTPSPSFAESSCGSSALKSNFIVANVPPLVHTELEEFEINDSVVLGVRGSPFGFNSLFVESGTVVRGFVREMISK